MQWSLLSTEIFCIWLLCELITKLYDCRKHLISPNTTKKREQKWLHMTANWDKYMTKNFKKVIRIKTIF